VRFLSATRLVILCRGTAEKAMQAMREMMERGEREQDTPLQGPGRIVRLPRV